MNAKETLEKTNEQLREMVLYHYLNPNDRNFNPFSMKISGVLDAAVNGGVFMYEKVSSENSQVRIQSMSLDYRIHFT